MESLVNQLPVSLLLSGLAGFVLGWGICKASAANQLRQLQAQVQMLKKGMKQARRQIRFGQQDHVDEHNPYQGRVWSRSGTLHREKMNADMLHDPDLASGQSRDVAKQVDSDDPLITAAITEPQLPDGPDDPYEVQTAFGDDEANLSFSRFAPADNDGHQDPAGMAAEGMATDDWDDDTVSAEELPTEDNLQAPLALRLDAEQATGTEDYQSCNLLEDDLTEFGIRVLPPSADPDNGAALRFTPGCSGESMAQPVVFNDEHTELSAPRVIGGANSVTFLRFVPAAAPATQSDASAWFVDYELLQLPAMTPSDAECFSREGIESTQQLWRRCASPQQRASLVRQYGLDEQQVQQWVQQSDLLRVAGLGLKHLQLLADAAITSTEQLAAADSFELLKRTGQRDSRQIDSWIAKAAELQRD